MPIDAHDPAPGIVDAVRAVGLVDRATGGAVDEAEYRVGERVATRQEPAHRLPLDRLADRVLQRHADGSQRILLPAAAAAVAIGKYSRPGQLKARAYVDGPTPMTVKVWRGEEAGAFGEREQAARPVVGAISHYRALPLLDGGRVGDLAYVREPLVFGRHPRSPREQRAAADDLMGALPLAYRAAGLHEEPLSVHLGSTRRRALTLLLKDRTLPWGGASGRRRFVRRRMLRLIAADRLLPTALGHGDLVCTNIIRDERGHHRLIDWEHAKPMPVAFDLAKLLISTAGDGRVSPVLRAPDGLHSGGRRRYRWSEQLALGLAAFIAMSASRRERAASAGRLEQFDEELGARLGWLAQLLS